MTAPVSSITPAPRGAPDTRRIITPAAVGRHYDHRFPGVLPETIAAILREMESGQVERGADLAEWVAEHPIIGSVLDTQLQSVASLPFELRPGMDRPGFEGMGQKAADEARRMLEETPRLESIFEEFLNAAWVGWSGGEHHWGRVESGGQRWWRSTPTTVRARDMRFATDWSTLIRTYPAVIPNARDYEAGGYAGKVEPLPGSNGSWLWVRAADHPDKFLTLPYKRRGSTPLRSGAMRTIVWYWMFMGKAIQSWNAGAERLANGAPHGKVPEDASDAVVQHMLSVLQNMADGQVGVLKGETEIIFPDTGFAGSAEVWNGLCQWLKEVVILAIMGSMDSVDGGANGSLARAEVQAEQTVEPRKLKLAKILWGMVERDWIRPFLAFNADKFGGVMPPMPTMWPRQAEEVTPQGQIYQYHLKGKLIQRKAVWSQLAIDPPTEEELAAQGLPPTFGDEFLDIQDLPVGGAPGFPAEAPPAASGGEPAAAPFSRAASRRVKTKPRQMALPLTSRSTSPTSSPSATNPIDAVLSGK